MDLRFQLRPTLVAIAGATQRHSHPGYISLAAHCFRTSAIPFTPLCIYVTHLHETSHMSAEFVFRYGPKCMGGVILLILVLFHL